MINRFKNALNGILMTASLLAVPSAWAASSQAPVPDVTKKMDWPQVMSIASPSWNTLPVRPFEAPMVGNGMLGTYLVQNTTTTEPRFEMSREDLFDVRSNFNARKTNGYFKLTFPSGKPEGNAVLDLWNARIKSEIGVGKEVLGVNVFADANSNVIVFELTPLSGAPVRYNWDFVPDTRGYTGGKGAPKGGYNPYPAPKVETVQDCQVCTQDMPVSAEYNTQKEPNSSQHATAWRIVAGSTPATKYIFTSVGYSYQRGPVARQEAVDNVNKAVARGFATIESEHQRWWHDYYRKSFVSMPEKYQTFHWLQTYKAACITREGNRHIPDLQGPWFDRNVGWNGIWWNWNLHTMFSSMYTSNHPELSNSLLNYLWDRRGQITFGGGYGMGRWSALYRGFGDGPEHGNLTSILCMLWENFMVTQDVEMMKTRLFPLLEGNYAYMMSKATTNTLDGKIHIPNGLSPEWNNLKKFNNALFKDTAYDLSALRWLCATLIYANDHYGLNAPDRVKWQDTLNKIVPYHTDPKEGFLIADGIHLDEPYRHPSHEYMMWPYLEYTPDDPAQNALIEKTLNHHDALGYSVFGMANAANAIVRAMQGNGDKALAGLDGNSQTYLQMPFVSRKTGRLAYFADRTGYCEEGPYLADRVLEEMLLSSFNSVIRVFPAIPSGVEWDNLAMDDFRAKGGFLVSAKRLNKKTQFIRIKSLAGAECKVKTGMSGKVSIASNYGSTLTDLGNGVARINGLKAGEWCILYSGDSMPELTMEPVASSGTNIASQKPTTQSLPGAENPWMRVDLGGNYTVDKIVLCVAPEAGSERLSNFTVSLLDTDEKTVWSGTRYSAPDPVTTLPDINISGRYIKVQANGGKNLGKLEVRAYGGKLNTNAAAGKKATQSSTYGGAVASRAVDGNTDGNFDHRSVSHTAKETKPWWQVDLGQDNPIDSIKIFNRTDAATERLADFTVSILDGQGKIVWSKVQATRPNPSVSFDDINKTGRKVKVQLNGNNYLALAEVQVLCKGKEQ